MCDRHLSQIDIAEQRIDLFPADANTIRSAPYRALSKAREFEKQEINKMLS